MWFIFPQLAGLGTSGISQRYAITSLAEAKAYLDHDVLGPRLIECTAAVNSIQDRSALEIFGYPDDMKFRSSLTLFELAADSATEFAAALEKYFGGERDERTHQLLRLAGAEGHQP